MEASHDKLMEYMKREGLDSIESEEDHIRFNIARKAYVSGYHHGKNELAAIVLNWNPSVEDGLKEKISESLSYGI